MMIDISRLCFVFGESPLRDDELEALLLLRAGEGRAARMGSERPRQVREGRALRSVRGCRKKNWRKRA